LTKFKTSPLGPRPCGKPCGRVTPPLLEPKRREYFDPVFQLEEDVLTDCPPEEELMAPTNVRFNGVNSFSWSPVDGVVGYEIFRDNQTEPIMLLDKSVTNFSDIDTTTPYQYWIRSVYYSRVWPLEE
jgi:hypothetical protein